MKAVLEVLKRFYRRFAQMIISNVSLKLLLLVVVFMVCPMVYHESSAAIVKRSFVKLGCMGQYDKADFATLDRICEECYNLYREPGLHSLCRSYCFKNDYFNGCVKALLLDDKESEIEVMVNRLFGGS